MPEYRGLPCPNRGAGLSHTQDIAARADGTCVYCGVMLTVNPDAIPAPVDETDRTLEHLMEAPSQRPPYSLLARVHHRDAMIAHRSLRPILAQQHAHWARKLQSASVMESEDPPLDAFEPQP